MSVYPITISKTTMGYTYGRSDKQYHVLVLHNADGRAVLINRWGKRGSWGKLDVQQYNSDDEAYKTAQKLTGYKISSRGYTIEAENTVECNDARKLIDALGPQYYYNIGCEALKWLDPDISVSGVKPPESLSPVFVQDKNGRWVPEPRPPRMPAELVPTPEPIVEKNPMWGLF